MVGLNHQPVNGWFTNPMCSEIRWAIPDWENPGRLGSLDGFFSTDGWFS